MVGNRGRIWAGVICLGLCVWSVGRSSGDEGPDSGPTAAEQTEAAAAVEAPETDGGRLTLEVARDRATVMQEVYVATLDMLHQRYFHRDRSLLPARAMHDIFDQLERRSHVQARWISASLPPMSNDHKPESEFEKRAAKEITAGSPQLEILEDGYYRRAVAVPLGGGCVGCHQGRARNPSKQHFAGLVVSIPVRAGEALPVVDQAEPRP